MLAAQSLKRYSLIVVVLTLLSGTMVLLHGTESRGPATSLSEQGLSTIYCRDWQDAQSPIQQVTAGSKERRPLPAGVRGEPSRALHAGHRWFADVRQTDPQDGAAAGTRYRLYVVRDDGMTVELNHGPSIEPQPGSVCWPSHGADGILSWVGRRCDDVGAVVEGGIYVTRLEYDEQGNVSVMKATSMSPIVSVPLVTLGESGRWFRRPVPEAESHDWSPDGKTVALASHEGKLYTIEVDGRQAKQLTQCPVSGPLWSPDGKLIAFKVRAPLGGVAIIPAGGGEPEVIYGPLQGTPFAVTSPCWSPSGRYVLFGYMGPQPAPPDRPSDMDLMAVDLAERRYVNLTTDVPGALIPTGWR